ncbi:MAG: hypothetical protein HRU15_01400 [Planctomycetes bacterium]|nr:hypothetical protein [Planctomycetota bacterium]
MSDKKTTHGGQQPDPALKKPPIGQTILVILLVALVGIIFGVGPSTFTMALGGKQVQEIEAGITNVDLARFQRLYLLLDIINSGTKPHELSEDEWGNRQQRLWYLPQIARQSLVIAKYAELDGMKPSGKALDKILNNFVNEKIINGDSRLNAIAAVQEANVVGRSFSRKELLEHLAIKEANANFDSRYNPNPVAVDSMGKVFHQKSKERVYVQEARLSTSAILGEFKELVAKDQDQLTLTYQHHLSLKRFEIPRKAHLTLFGADATLIAASVVISDEAIAAWYNENKELDPNLKTVTIAEPEKKDDSAAKDKSKKDAKDKDGEKAVEEEPAPPVIVTKTLAESKAYIRAKLESETSTQILNELCENLVQAVQDSDLLDNFLLIEGKEAELIALIKTVRIPASDERLTAEVGLTVWTDVSGDDPGIDKDVQLLDKDGKSLAQFSQQGPLYLFNGERGKISLPQLAGNKPSFKAMILTDSIDPATDKELETVKEEVIMLAAVEKAEPELIKRAQALQAELSTEADRDLNAFFAAADRSFWAAAISEKDYGPLEKLEAPDAVSEMPIIAYTQAGKQYALVTDSKNDEEVTVKLVKIIRHEIKDSEGEIDLRSSRESYIRAVNSVSRTAFNKELEKQREL